MKRRRKIIVLIVALVTLTILLPIETNFYRNEIYIQGKHLMGKPSFHDLQLTLNQFFPVNKVKETYEYLTKSNEDLSIVEFNENTFKEEMEDLWNRVDYFNNHILPSVPKDKLRTRKMKTNFTFLDFNNLKLIKTFIRQNKKLKITKKNNFLNYNLENQPIINITEKDNNFYFRNYGNVSCFIEGTHTDSINTCKCKKGWFGSWCSFPKVLSETKFIKSSELLKKVRPRKTPRRIINLLTFSMEFEMLLIRLGELGKVIDRFVILESNITSYGDPKPLYLMSMLKRGFIEDYHHKIIYTHCKHFLTEAYLNGWLADDHLRRQLDETVSKRLRGLHDDDIIMYNDADEIPSKQAMLFLKFHDGYPDIISINFDRRTYGFFWKDIARREHSLQAAAPFSVYKNVFQNHSVLLRNRYNTKFVKYVNKYLKSKDYDLRSWGIGKGTLFAGWHCSTCFNPESIRIKMQSALNEDYPRWGDYENTYDMKRLKQYIIGEGHFFDNKKTLQKVDKNNEEYIPQYVSENKELFTHLIDNPYST